jgi:hypothetical protein
MIFVIFAKINIKVVRIMAKKGIQNSSIEQIRNDHEEETAFLADNPKKNKKQNKK